MKDHALAIGCTWPKQLLAGCTLITIGYRVDSLCIYLLCVTAWILENQLKCHIWCIKIHGSESQGQEEAVCMRVFWPTRPLQ